MLSFTRRAGQSFFINGDELDRLITVTIREIDEHGHARIAIDAPREITIYRRELQEKIEKGKRNGTKA